MSKLVFLFVFIFSMFSPHVINLGGNMKTDKFLKKEVVIKKVTSKTVKQKGIISLSGWHVAKASYYDSNDSTQTREDCDGVGALGRQIKSGSIALGSSFTEGLRKDEMVFVQVKNFNIVTPYGKGIFRVDDVMSKKFSRNGFHVDFFHEDLDSKHKLLGRFPIWFRIYKIVKTTDLNYD